MANTVAGGIVFLDDIRRVWERSKTRKRLPQGMNGMPFRWKRVQPTWGPLPQMHLQGKARRERREAKARLLLNALQQGKHGNASFTHSRRSTEAKRHRPYRGTGGHHTWCHFHREQTTIDQQLMWHSIRLDKWQDERGGKGMFATLRQW